MLTNIESSAVESFLVLSRPPKEMSGEMYSDLTRDFDNLLGIEPGNFPDVFLVEHGKVGAVGLEFYFNQYSEGVGSVRGPFVSSSCLFNIDGRSTLDAVKISGYSDTERAAKEISSLYKQYQWTTAVLDGRGIPKILMPRTNGGLVPMANPRALVNLARKHINYGVNKHANRP